MQDEQIHPDFPLDTSDAWKGPAKASLRTSNPNSFAVGRKKAYANADEATMTDEQRMKYNDPRTQSARKRAMAGNKAPVDAMGLGREDVPVMPGGLAGLDAMQDRMKTGAMPGTLGGRVAELPFQDPSMRRNFRQQKAVGMMNIA